MYQRWRMVIGSGALSGGRNIQASWTGHGFDTNSPVKGLLLHLLDFLVVLTQQVIDVVILASGYAIRFFL